MMISDKPARQAVHLREDEVPLLHEVALDGIVRQILVGLGQTLAALALDLSRNGSGVLLVPAGRHRRHRFRVKQPRRGCAKTLFSALGVKWEQQGRVPRASCTAAALDRRGDARVSRGEARQCAAKTTFLQQLRETYASLSE